MEPRSIIRQAPGRATEGARDHSSGVAKTLGTTQRTISYYEGGLPTVLLLGGLASALGVTTDELLGLKPSKLQDSPQKRRLWKRLQRIESLPERDQRAVIRLINSLSTVGTSEARAKIGKLFLMAPANERQHAHELIDRMPMAQVSAIVQMIEAMLDPVSRAVATLPSTMNRRAKPNIRPSLPPKHGWKNILGRASRWKTSAPISASPWMISSGHDRRVKKIIFTIPAHADVRRIDRETAMIGSDDVQRSGL